MTRVQVSGEQDVGAAGGKRLHREPRPAYDGPRLVARRQVEWMVRYHQLDHALAACREAFPYASDLRAVDAPALEHCRARGAHADDRDLIVHERRLDLFADVAAVFGERLQETLPEVVERNVVVSRHDQERPR